LLRREGGEGYGIRQGGSCAPARTSGQQGDRTAWSGDTISEGPVIDRSGADRHKKDPREGKSPHEADCWRIMHR
jgi:hypothetical protein